MSSEFKSGFGSFSTCVSVVSLLPVTQLLVNSIPSPAVEHNRITGAVIVLQLRPFVNVVFKSGFLSSQGWHIEVRCLATRLSGGA